MRLPKELQVDRLVRISDGFLLDASVREHREIWRVREDASVANVPDLTPPFAVAGNLLVGIAAVTESATTTVAAVDLDTGKEVARATLPADSYAPQGPVGPETVLLSTAHGFPPKVW